MQSIFFQKIITTKIKLEKFIYHMRIKFTWGSDILTPFNSLKALTKKSRRSRNALTICETASPPAYPIPKAATAAFWDMLLAPEVDWVNKAEG